MLHILKKIYILSSFYFFFIKVYNSKKVTNIFNNNLIRNNTFIEIMKDLMYNKR